MFQQMENKKEPKTQEECPRIPMRHSLQWLRSFFSEITCCQVKPRMVLLGHYTTSSACKELSISKRDLKKLEEDGAIVSLKCLSSNYRFYKKEDIERLLKKVDKKR